MGIFSRQPGSPAYVPPQTGDTSTLLGGGGQPPGDPDRARPTKVDLHFEPVGTGGGRSHHGYIVVTDGTTQKQWTTEALPSERRARAILPSGFVQSFVTEGQAAPRASSRHVATFETDVPADQVAGKLSGFSERFNERKIPYDLPINLHYDPYGLAPPQSPVRNSNYYVGSAWADLTGATPALPPGLDAPGWGDHRKKGQFE